MGRTSAYIVGPSLASITQQTFRVFIKEAVLLDVSKGAAGRRK
jgi:hypothetical protein